jgi:hypothetical protein
MGSNIFKKLEHFRLSVLGPATACGALLCSIGATSQGPASVQAAAPAAEGYVTALHLPAGFDVNGQSVSVNPATTYEWFGGKEVTGTPTFGGDLQVGVYVEVIGTRGTQGVNATAVHLRATPEKAIKGFGLIVRVVTAASEPVFEADGYHLRIPAGATIKFAGDLKSLEDIGPNVWVKYTGLRDANGDLVASQAEFAPARLSRTKALIEAGAYGTNPNAPKFAKLAVQQSGAIAEDKLIDANGRMVSTRAKIRFSDSGGWCGWHRVPADQVLQARVLRVGMSVVPAYQKDLQPNNPWKIPFRFYAVDDKDNRFALACNDGLILVPRQVAERLKSNDQLASVIAVAVAYNLMRQSARLDSRDYLLLGVEVASVVPYVSVGSLGMYAGADAAAFGLSHEMIVQLQEECERMAIAITAEAGYNPWQAPEAVRLLAPKELPADTRQLKYPNQAGYELAFLHLQYGHKQVTKPSVTPVPVN